MNTPNRTEWNGFYRALVINDRDPLFKGRVKVRIPDFMVADEKRVGKWDSNGLWASPANNALGGRSIQDTQIRHKGPDAYYQGQCLIPPKGTHVWVFFEKNDISHPFYLGSAEYGDCQTLPENQLGENYQKKWTLLKTCQGRTIIASDDDSDARFEITGKKRLIKDPPFGDIDSVYKIDDNQSVFLIDERPDHEKIMLKDYRGNFFKLIQNENGKNDQLHVKIKDDVHIEFDKDFYLTIFGNCHIKVMGDMFTTCLKNIYTNATLALKETALSFDRFSTNYDNTFSGLVNVKSTSNINHTAVMKIFEESILNVRNSMITSDVTIGLTSICAGAAIGITAGGAVSIYGGGGTAIQSTPIILPLTGSTKPAEISPISIEANPDPKRYEKIILPPKAPILTTPTGGDSLNADSFEHSSVSVSQSNTSHVNSGSTCCGSSSQTSSSCSSGGCCGSNSSIEESLKKTQDTTDTTKTTETLKTTQNISSCVSDCVKTIYSDIKSAKNAKSSALKCSVSVIDKVSDQVYGIISGVNTETDVYKPDSSFITNILEQSNIQYSDNYNNIIHNVTENITDSILKNISIEVPSLNNLSETVSDNIKNDSNYLINQFTNDCINTFYNSLSSNSSLLLSKNFKIQDENKTIDIKEYEKNILDSILTIIYNIENYKDETIFKETILNSITNIIEQCIYDYCDSYINVINRSLYYDYNNHISLLINLSNNSIDDKGVSLSNIINDDIKQISKLLYDTIINSNNNLKEILSSSINLNINDDSFLTSKQLDNNIYQIQQIINSFCSNCTKETFLNQFKSDPDYFDEVKDQFLSDIMNTIDNNTIESKEANIILSRCNNLIYKTIIEFIDPIIQNPNEQEIQKQISYVVNNIQNNIAQQITALNSVYANFLNNIKDLYFNKLIEKTKHIYQNRVTNIVNNILYNKNIDTNQLNEIKTEIISIINDIKNYITQPNIFSDIITKNDIISCVNILKNGIEKYYPTYNTLIISIEEFRKDFEKNINNNRKDLLETIFDLDDNIDNQFSKYNTKIYEIPNHCGCGYNNTLFLKDKYRKTLAPLIANSNANILAFDLCIDTSKFEYSVDYKWNPKKYNSDTGMNGVFEEVRLYHQLYDEESIKSYEKIWTDLKEFKTIDTSTKWWQNLKNLMNQLAILDIIAIITIQDFNDSNNPFIKDINSDDIYTDKMWRDDFEGIFLETLFNFIKETQCKVIYNLGYGSFKNPVDTNNSVYKIYPNCGYLRRFIMWTVYNCNITSNILALTANDDDNLYYYNPYCGWKTYDDYKDHKLEDYEISLRDCIDNKYNDESDIVTYQDGKISGGYAGYLISCQKHSIPVFNMNDLISKISADMDINDPNIMKDIFCKKSRNAIRFFKSKNYFEFVELEFDQEGEVI